MSDSRSCRSFQVVVSDPYSGRAMRDVGLIVAVIRVEQGKGWC
jgi:hypothetical protein